MKTTAITLVALLVMSPASAKPPADIQAKLDAWIKDQPGGISAAWVDAAGTTFFHAGKIAADDPREITPDTPYEIGSITKIFTAVLLAQSEQLGKVSRNDSAAKYLLPPDDPDQAALAKITLLALTTHTSGLPRMPENFGTNSDSIANPYSTYGRAALVSALRTHGKSAIANSAVSYSNFGVSVLGEALGDAWGTSYADALREQVLAPLHLNATTVGITGTPAPAGLAPGHTDGKCVPNWTALACAGCGAIRSSARDMALFLSAFLHRDQSPLRASLEATTQPHYPVPDTGGQIGLGWMITAEKENPVYWHNGATAGSHAFIAFNPKNGTGVVLLANVQQGSEELGFSLLGVTPARPKTAVANSGDYPGYYPISPAFGIAITEKDGSLIAQGTGQPPFPLRPNATDRFAVSGVPAEISFERNPEGKIIALILHQNGIDQRALRGEAPPAPKEITLPLEILRDYVGDYPLSAQFVLSITEADGTLFAQATGQGKAPVFAKAKDEFFYKIVAAQLTFTRDAAGKVNGLILHQNGRNQPAKKKE